MRENIRDFSHANDRHSGRALRLCHGPGPALYGSNWWALVLPSIRGPCALALPWVDGPCVCSSLRPLGSGSLKTSAVLVNTNADS
jgi:hypothetical protein